MKAVSTTGIGRRTFLERTAWAVTAAATLARVARLWPILAPRLPAWHETLEFFKRQGLLQDAYRLTPRGAEVCDSILAELV